MFEKQRDHFKIINASLAGSSPLDEETFSSVAVLSERLDKLKRSSDQFKDITFSDQLEELAECEMISAIC